jgi:hypothetical protein
MINYPDQIKAGLELESRVAALATEEPDIARLLEGLRLLEAAYGEDVAIVERNGHRSLYRTYKSGKMTTYAYLTIKDGRYIIGVMTGADQYDVVCPNFVAAVFRFAGKPVPTLQAIVFTSWTIATMAPEKPDILPVLAALRILEDVWGEDLAITMDGQSGHGYLRRATTDGENSTHWSVGTIDGKYVTYRETTSDRQEETYPNFVAAVYGFAGKPLPPLNAAALTKAAENTAALRS